MVPPSGEDAIRWREHWRPICRVPADMEMSPTLPPQCVCEGQALRGSSVCFHRADLEPLSGSDREAEPRISVGKFFFKKINKKAVQDPIPQEVVNSLSRGCLSECSGHMQSPSCSRGMLGDITRNCIPFQHFLVLFFFPLSLAWVFPFILLNNSIYYYKREKQLWSY